MDSCPRAHLLLRVEGILVGRHYGHTPNRQGWLSSFLLRHIGQHALNVAVASEMLANPVWGQRLVTPAVRGSTRPGGQECIRPAHPGNTLLWPCPFTTGFTSGAGRDFSLGDGNERLVVVGTLFTVILHLPWVRGRNLNQWTRTF